MRRCLMYYAEIGTRAVERETRHVDADGEARRREDPTTGKETVNRWNVVLANYKRAYNRAI